MSFQAHKTLAAHAVKAGGKPGEDQLKLINRFTLDELTEDQVYVRTAILAHSGIDRDRDAFEKALLEDFARTLPGKGLFVKHPGGWDGDSSPGVGRWFDARVVEVSKEKARELLREPGLQFPEEDDKAYLLEADYFTVRTEKNSDLIIGINAGIVSDVSIGFAASKRSAMAKNDEGEVLAWRVHAPGEALEGSLVWLGAQPGARTVKNHDRGQQGLIDDIDTEGKAVDLEQKLKEAKNKNTELEGKVTEHETTINELKPKAANYDALAKVAGSDKEPADHDDIKAMVEAGKAYIDNMVDTIVKSDRLNETLKDDQEAVDEAKAFYRKMPLKLLKQKFEQAKEALPKGGQLDGGDPNANKGATKSGLRDASVTQKALGDKKAA